MKKYKKISICLLAVFLGIVLTLPVMANNESKQIISEIAKSTFTYNRMNKSGKELLVVEKAEENFNSPFKDVCVNQWFFKDIEYVFNHSLMNGTTPDEFFPDAPLTRGMVVTVLYRHAGSPKVNGLSKMFSDIDENEYYTAAVQWAYSNSGIIQGYPDGTFRPDENISREDLSVILDRYAGFAQIILPITDRAMVFDDKETIADYAILSVKKLFEGLIIDGKPDDIFDPKGTSTRAEFAAMLHRLFTIDSNLI